MEPSGCEYNPEHYQDEEQKRETELYNYQIRWAEEDGTIRTKLIEATYVEVDDDFVELWNDNVLILMIERSSVKGIRNVSLLDMRNLD